MKLAAETGGRLVAALAAEPGFARIASPRTPVLLWHIDSDVPVWTSTAGRELLGRLPKELDGAPRLPAATSTRLRILGEGLAPRSGLRLERLRWGSMDAPLTLHCRLLSVDGEDLLLTALLQSEGAASRQSEPREELPLATDTAAEAKPSGATIILPLPRGRRFSWQSGADGRFSFVSPDLAEIVGTRGADIVGWRWGDLVGRLVEDEHGAVASAWGTGRRWTRHTIGWRDPDHERLIPVQLSGAPVAGTDGLAYRGFGIAHPEQSRAIAPRTFLDLPSRGVSRPEEEPATPIADEAGPPTTLDGKSGETVFNMLRAWLVSPDGAPQALPAARSDDRTPMAQTDQGGALSTSERGALSEIARTLGRPPGEPPRLVEERPSADIVTLPRVRPRTGELTSLLDRLPVGMVVLRDGVPIFANRLILDRLGIPDLPQAVAQGALQRLAKLGPDDAASGTVALVDADGAEQGFEARTTRVDWGDMGADLVLLTPPTAAPTAEAEALRLDLAVRERRLDELRSALDLAADGVVTLDSSARLLSLTRSAERLFGIAANEVVGDSITALIEPRDHRVALACLDALRTGASTIVQHCEVRGRTRGGTTMPLSMRAGPASGGEAGFSVAFSDVTHFRLLEDDLREARAEAEEASANRAEFLARISHEVRTPLTAITGFAELMLEERFGQLGNERYKGYIRDIRDSGIHVISLVNDLLDLAKATSGTEDLQPSALDLNAVVQQCVALASPLAGQAKTIIRTSFPAGLPRVLADERSVRQVAINLLSNAIRFTGAGGQVIVSTAVGAPGEVVLSVRDTGPGMSDKEVETALTPFRQVSSTRRGDGTGLGLPLSKALTEANGGVFVVTSAPDLGTLVEVRLPVENHGAVAAE